MPSLGHLLLYMLIPAATMMGGAALGSWRTPSSRVRSALHHLAAGGLLAAAAGELVVELAAEHHLVALALGFAAGAAVMLLVRLIADRVERTGGGQGLSQVVGLLAAIAVDVFVDGVVVGIGFAIGQSSGLVFVIAFAVEMAFLGVTAAVEIGGAGGGKRQVFAGPTALAAFLLLGSVAGHFLGSLSGFGFEVVIAFATAVLIYLVAEELLVEAHEEEEAPLMASFFFLGFLGILLLDFGLK